MIPQATTADATEVKVRIWVWEGLDELWLLTDVRPTTDVVCTAMPVQYPRLPNGLPVEIHTVLVTYTKVNGAEMLVLEQDAIQYFGHKPQ